MSHLTLRAKRATFTFTFYANLASFGTLKGFDQTVLPDRSILIDQKLVENAKITFE